MIKHSKYEDASYIDVVCGFDSKSFGKKNDSTYDIYEFIVKEDNLDYVLASLEKIYRNDDQIMEACYISVKLTTRYDSEPCPTVLDINRECPFSLAFSGFAVYGKDFFKFWV